MNSVTPFATHYSVRRSEPLSHKRPITVPPPKTNRKFPYPVTICLPSGDIREEVMSDRLPDTNLTIKFPDGRCYEGCFRDGEMHGAGRMTWPEGSLVEEFEGSFQNGEIHPLITSIKFAGREKITKVSIKDLSPEDTNLLEAAFFPKYQGEDCCPSQPEDSMSCSGNSQMRNFIEMPSFAHFSRADFLKKMRNFLLKNLPNRYIGFLIDGKKSGTGILIQGDLDNFAIYSGLFREDKKHGKGEVFSYADGIIKLYEGEWQADVFLTGEGYLNFPDGTSYQGSVTEEKGNGRGKIVYRGKEQKICWYEGDVKDNHPHGEGTYYWANDEYYTGEFVAGKMCGKGKRHYASGERLEGQFADNKCIDGTCIFRNQEAEYRGKFNLNGQPHGLGEWKNNKRGSIYKGQFENGKIIHGEYTVDEGAEKYKGGFLVSDNQTYFHGEGELTLIKSTDSKSFQVIYKGIFDKGSLPKGELLVNSGASRYKGSFNAQKQPDGKGTMTFASGDRFIGTFGKGNMVSGRLRLKSGNVYEGPFNHGLPHGQGNISVKGQTKNVICFNGWSMDGRYCFTPVKPLTSNQRGAENTPIILPDGSKLIATFSNNRLTGGVRTYENGDIYQGEFNAQGEPEGNGRMFIRAEAKTMEGIFKNGQYIRPAKKGRNK